jgi:hypothetical protein
VIVLLVPDESQVHSVEVCTRHQVALFAYVRLSLIDKINYIYLARSPTSLWSVHDQEVVLLAVSFRSQVQLADLLTSYVGA